MDCWNLEGARNPFQPPLHLAPLEHFGHMTSPPFQAFPPPPRPPAPVFAVWEAAQLCDGLLQLMEASAADWTLTWRKLADVAEASTGLGRGLRFVSRREAQRVWAPWALRIFQACTQFP